MNPLGLLPPMLVWGALLAYAYWIQRAKQRASDDE